LPLGVWLGAAALVFFVVGVYLPTLEAGFIWDDDVYVQENPTLGSLAGLRDIWFRLGAVPQYYPLVHTSYWLEHEVWGTQPAGYHVVNLLLHALAALLVWRLLARLSVPGAWLAAAIFAVHPVAVESVAWITERKNVLSFPLALGAILAYLRFSPPETATQPRATAGAGMRWLFYALALALFMLALASKTVTASVPAVLLVIYWWKRGVTRRDVVLLAPLFVVGLAMAGVTVWMERTFVGASGQEWDFSLVDRLLIAGRALWFYAGKLVWPHPLVFFYPRWTIDSSALWQYLYPAAAVAVIVALWLARNRVGRGPLAAVLIFAGVLAPALGFFDVYPFIFSFVADHFQYHASVALVALFAAMLSVAVRRLAPRSAWIMPLAAVMILAPLAVTAHRRTAVYHDLTTLYEDTIAANPEAWAAHVNLGYALQREGQFDEAVDHYRRALAINQRQTSVRVRLGTALFLSGKVEQGVAEIEQALAGELTDFERSIAHVHYGIMLNFQRRFDRAIEQLEKALALRPDNAGALLNLGIALWERGERGAGIERVRQSLAIHPASALAQNKLGTMLLDSDRVEESLAPLMTAVALQPANPRFREDLARARIGGGDLDGAQRELRLALELDPGSAEACYWLGVVFQRRGNLETAAAAFKAALERDRNHARAAESLRALEAARRASDG
jgi:tetratricopeptide (TPR) repeat protein